MRILAFMFCIAALVSATPLYLIDSVPETKGNDLIGEGSVDSAISVIQSYAYNDSSYLLLKKAELAIIEERFGDAKRLLREAAGGSERLAPYAFRRIGDIELLQHEISYAIVSYRYASELTDLSSYHYFLNELADSLGDVYREELEADGWHTLLFPEVVEVVKDDTLDEHLKERLKEGVTEVEFDSLLAIAKENGIEKVILNSLRDTSDVRTPFSTKRRFEHSQYLSSIGTHSDASKWLHFTINQSDFKDSVDQKKYLRYRTMLNYSLKNWSNVVTWSTAYFERYGHTSELVYHTARSYRKMGMTKKADYWYAEHIRRYPTSKRSHDILWYQAWQFEDRGSFDTAIVRFRSLAKKFPNGKHGDDAAFRVGLLYYRKNNFKEAVKEFELFSSRFKDSRLLPGAYYWKGRALHNLKNEEKSKESLVYVTEEWPLDYFAWRARQFTGTMDSFQISTVEFDFWYDSLKSVSSMVSDTLARYNADSLFTLAVQLGTIGYVDEAVLLLEPFEVRGYKNYAQLFELSKFYDMIGEHYHAFKLTKSIFWALPSGLRKALPVEYLERLYPQAYPEQVKTAAERMGVNPHLVRAIMRQESMFSASIVSYVGAVGLMQIMPYTGKEIANDLDTTFNDSILYNPNVNITFGTHYIGKLLKQFDQHVVKAVASYNGGPHNVKKWVKRSADVIQDEPYFSECIGFSETRNYVKRVLENLWIYETLDRQFADTVM